MKTLARSETKLPASVKHRLDAYALAASAAGIGLLTLPASSSAEVIFTPAHVLITTGGSYKLDVNNDGIVDFILFDTRSGGTFVYAEGIGISNKNQNHVFGYTSTTGFCGVPDLGQGKVIGPNGPFCHSAPRYYLAVAQRTFSQYRSFGSWRNVNNRYLGFLFKADGERHFGWARLGVQIDKGHVLTRLTGYAYESTPETPITTGQRLKDSSAQDPPESQNSDAVQGSLGILALGVNRIPSSRP